MPQRGRLRPWFLANFFNFRSSTQQGALWPGLIQRSLKQSLLELDVELEVKLNPNIHDREIRLDNGWVVKIGRGLDFYQRPSGWFEVGAHDLNLRKCLETKVDIFRA